MLVNLLNEDNMFSCCFKFLLRPILKKFRLEFPSWSHTVGLTPISCSFYASESDVHSGAVIDINGDLLF